MTAKNKQSESRPPSPSLGEYVYQRLLKEIREGKYHPGERIRESVVSKELDVSRTPVREAIRRLQSEGKLILEPQRGAVVAELDSQEVAELYVLRQQLEGVAARFAAQHASKSEVASMEYILEECYKAADDPREHNQLNWELHHAIYRAAHNRFLLKAFAAISDSMALLRGVKYIPKGRPQELYKEHKRIIEAIKQQDPDAADQAAQAHIENAFKIHLQSDFERRSAKK
ncbi:MAG: GntR family transcriptional regulator [Oceanospirillaceae bacterium]|nr:GntR family transcriptional regulator [Oceanospirillaceae bacterium]